MENIIDKLFTYKDEKYKEFTSKLIPNISINKIIGIRIPILRSLAKELYKNNEYQRFLSSLPNHYPEENLLHGSIISLFKDYDTCIEEIERFLPYIDNWSVSDTISPKIFNKNKDKLLNKIKEWCASSKTYTIRFGVLMLMQFYLDEDFKKEYLAIPLRIKSDEYYVNMMIAWFYATALAKQYDEAVKIIEKHELDPWVHNKTIQKAKESYRVSNEHKNYLDKLKIKGQISHGSK